MLAESRYIEHNDFPDDIDEGYSSKTPICDIQYMYGINGITGFRLKRENSTVWEDYYYRKNLQGDVTHIVDFSGVVKAEYIYDAWGNCTTITDIGGIGSLNPIRYRGYYFDVETGLYYLQSRYYDPEVGRFINMDDISYLEPGRINGLNLYSYCGNNPVMYYDPSGKSLLLLFGLIGAALGATAILKGAESAKKAADSGTGFFETAGAFFTGFGKGFINTTVSIGTQLYMVTLSPMVDWVGGTVWPWLSENFVDLLSFIAGQVGQSYPSAYLITALIEALSILYNYKNKKGIPMYKEI